MTEKSKDILKSWTMSKYFKKSSDILYVLIDGENASFNRISRNFAGSFKIREEIPVIDGEIVVEDIDKNGDNIKYVRVTSIADNAFRECRCLETVHIPSGVTEIGSTAFCNCSSLREIEIPSSVNYIGEGAFSGCDALKVIFYWQDERKKFVCKGEKQRNEFVKEYNKQHKSNPSVDVADGQIDPVFLNTALKSDSESICIPEGITVIPDRAFSNNQTLEITIASSVISIGNSAFAGCVNLEKIKIALPSSLTYIGDGAFKGCTKLIDADLSQCQNLTYIGNRAFFKCSSLESIKIPPRVSFIGNEAFSGCSKLRGIEIPSGLKCLSSKVFKGCSSLPEIEIPSSVSSIGEEAFSECTKLKEIDITSDYTRFGASVFKKCFSLEKLIILGRNAVITFPLLCDTPQCIELEIVSDNYCKYKNCIYNKRGTRLLEFVNPNSSLEIKENEIIIHDHTAVIGESAFHNLRGIKKITIPSNVSIICSRAFQKGPDVSDVFIKIEDPNKASINEKAFIGINPECIFHVPVCSGYAYRHHEGIQPVRG